MYVRTEQRATLDALAFLTTLDGFILDENRWDSLPLDGLLLRQLDKQTQGRLERAGYLGFGSSME